MANKTFTGPGNFNDNTKWDGSVLPSAGDNLTITTGTCTVTANDSTVYGTLTINSGITFNLQTYNFFCGAVTVNGTLQIGVSADTGLTCAGITFAVGSTGNYQAASKMYNSGNYIMPNANVFTTTTTLTYYQTDSGNFDNSRSNDRFYRFELTVGKTITLLSNSYFTGFASAGFFLYGTIDLNNFNIYGILASATGEIEFGPNCDIIGDTSINFAPVNGFTLTFSKASAMSFTGIVYSQVRRGSNRGLVTGRWDNADYYIQLSSPGSGEPATSSFVGGDLYCKDFKFSENSTYAVIIDCASNNPNFIISGDIDLTITDTLTWTKGTGTIKLAGTNQSIDFQGQDVENVKSTSSIGDVSILAADTWNISNQSLTTDYFTINGTLIMNDSSVLTCAGMNFVAGHTFTATNDGTINNSGDIIIATNGTWIDGSVCHYIQTGNGNASMPGSSRKWYALTINAAVRITQIADCYWVAGAGNVIINGELDVSTHLALLNPRSGNFTLGANSDFIGTGIVRFGTSGTTLVSKASTFSFAGTIQYSLTGSVTNYIIYGDWRTADNLIYINDANDKTFILSNTNRFKSFKVQSNYDQTITITNSNADIYIHTGDCLLYDNTQGEFTLTYNKGTGTWYLMGTGNACFYDKSIENLNITGTYTILSGFTSDNADFDGTITFTEGESYSVQDITGTGTLVAASGTVYITYHGSNTFTGTLTNVILVQADVSGEEKYPTTIDRLNRAEVV